MIIIHVVFAISALAMSLINNYRPSAVKLKASYSLAVGTLSSGVLLIIVNNASVLRTCLTGIVFFGVVSILNETARHRLAVDHL
jgi:hypothetical protein